MVHIGEREREREREWECEGREGWREVGDGWQGVREGGREGGSDVSSWYVQSERGRGMEREREGEGWRGRGREKEQYTNKRRKKWKR